MDQIGRQCRQPIVLLLRPAILDGDIPTLDKASFAQAMAEGAQPARVPVGGCAAEIPDHRQPSLLRPRRNRPRRCRTADQRDELAPPDHSITSSARATSVGGTWMPSAAAVLRLITSSNFVGCSTGKSAGLTPFNTLST